MSGAASERKFQFAAQRSETPHAVSCRLERSYEKRPKAMKTKPSLARVTCPKTMAGRLRTACATKLLPLVLLALPASVQAQFTYTTNNGTITITGHTGSGSAVTIPSTMNGLPISLNTVARRCFLLRSMS
jgi:hypothetical protein